MPAKDQDRLLYTIREAARLLSVSEQTLRKYIRQGKLAQIKLGGDYRAARCRVERAELDRFVAAQKARQQR